MGRQRQTAEQIVTNCGWRRGAGEGQHGGGDMHALGHHGPDLLPLAEGTQRAVGGSGQAVQGAQTCGRRKRLLADAELDNA